VTVRLKAPGVYGEWWRPRGTTRPHRRKLGLLAPASAIEAARQQAMGTADKRVTRRAADARHRASAEETYQGDFEAAVRAWLNFAPEHAGLADEIAAGAAARAVVVGSGRVGRTKIISLEERAALASRAFIRHRITA